MFKNFTPIKILVHYGLYLTIHLVLLTSFCSCNQSEMPENESLNDVVKMDLYAIGDRIDEAIKSGDNERILQIFVEDIPIETKFEYAIWNDMTTLHVASENGLYDVAAELIKRGANTNSIAYFNDGIKILVTSHSVKNICTQFKPIDFALNNEHYNIAELLFDNGANLNVFNAVKMGKVDLVKEQLQLESNYNIRDCDEVSLLDNAIIYSNLDIVKYLIAKGAKLNYSKQDGRSSIEYAVNSSNAIESIEYLSDNDSNYKHNIRKALSYVIKKHDWETAGILINEGVDINLTNQLGYTLLDETLFQCNDPFAKWLVENGSDLTVGCPTCSAANCNIDTLQYLIDLGADVNSTAINGQTALHKLLIEFGDDSLNEKLDILKYLIAKGANVNIQDDRLNTPLHYSRNCSASKILIENGANVNLINKIGETPIAIASATNNIDCVKFLLENDANIKMDFEKIYNPLCIAVKENHNEIINILLQYSPIFECNYTTALHIAVSLESSTIFRTLLNKVQDIDIEDSDGNSALHIATLNGNTEICEILFNNNADINARNEMGRTPIYFAAQSGNIEIIDSLISNGANINEIDKFGFMPINVSKNCETAKYLLKRSEDSISNEEKEMIDEQLSELCE